MGSSNVDIDPQGYTGRELTEGLQHSHVETKNKDDIWFFSMMYAKCQHNRPDRCSIQMRLNMKALCNCNKHQTEWGQLTMTATGHHHGKKCKPVAHTFLKLLMHTLLS